MQKQELSDLLTKAIAESQTKENIALEIPVDILWVMITELQRNVEVCQIDPSRKAAMYSVYFFLHHSVEPKLPTYIKRVVELGWREFGIRFSKKKKRRKN